MSRPQVHITEQAMREGMQIESVDISIDDKVRLIDALSATGLAEIMVGSFVSPRYTPQMARVDELLSRFTPRPGVRYTALALNQKGRERRAEYGSILTVDDRPPSLMCHMCDTFIRRNANISQQDEIARWPQIVEQAAKDGAASAGIGVNATFGSNFTGPVPIERRFELMRQQHQLWTQAGIPVVSVFMGDPMGWVTPERIGEHIAAIKQEWPDIEHFYTHLHDSRGLALASTYEVIRLLDDRHHVYVDTTAGGIGGCPYCGNGRATGMAATEDLVNMLHQMGIETGVDLPALIRAVWLLEEILGRPTPGHVSKAGPHPSNQELYDPNLPLIETHDEAKHFLLGPSVADHQIRPWREPIPPAAAPALP